MLYRILTENKNEPKVRDLVSKYFDGFTVYHGTGYWKGTPEKSLIIELSSVNNSENVYKCANQIKTFNKQESVLVQELAEVAKFI